jgi:hypothetical protein
VASVKLNGPTVRQVLTAACAATAFFLMGCDDSSVTAVQNASAQAAGRAISAGEPRATPKLISEVNNDGLRQMLENRAKTGPIADYVAQNPADKDLNDAIKQLQDALGLDPKGLARVGLQSQLAATQLQLSDARLAPLRADLMTLNQQAAAIIKLAQSVADLNTQITALENTKSDAAPDVSGAQDLVTQKQQALTAAKSKVDDLQKQIAAKEAQARQIYTDTDAAFAAAEAQKGKPAITAATKAMDDRKQAEKLMSDAGILAPELARAQADVDLAQVALNDAQRASTTAQATAERVAKAASEKNGRLQELRDAAAKLVDPPGANKDNGLNARVAACVATFAKLDREIRDAAAPAVQSAANFKTAATGYHTYANEVTSKATEAGIDAADPLMKVFKDDRSEALMAWSQSAAQQQAGRIYLSGVQAFDLLGKAVNAATQAKIKVDAKFATPAADPARAEFAKLADGLFDDAANSAKGGTDRNGTELEKIKWLGYSLAATAYHGAYLAGNSGALTNAKASRTKAVEKNAALEAALNWTE